MYILQKIHYFSLDCKKKISFPVPLVPPPPPHPGEKTKKNKQIFDKKKIQATTLFHRNINIGKRRTSIQAIKKNTYIWAYKRNI